MGKLIIGIPVIRIAPGRPTVHAPSSPLTPCSPLKASPTPLMSAPTDAPLILAGALPDSGWLPLTLRKQAADDPAWLSFVARAELVEALIEPPGAVPEPGHLRYIAHRLQLERPAVWPALELLEHISSTSPPQRVDAAHPLNGGMNPIWRIQPVHFLLGRDHIRLMDPRNLNLDLSESRALVQAVSAVFEAEGLSLAMSEPHLWWLTAHTAQADLSLETFSLVGAIGRSIDARLPRGEHRRRWQRLLNECQMIWHSHPVNAQREASGQLPVNGLWIEGPAHRGIGLGQASNPVNARINDALPALQRIDTRLLEAQTSGDPSVWLETWKRVCGDYFSRQQHPARGAGTDSGPGHGMAPGITVLTGDGGWRVLGLRSSRFDWTRRLRRLMGRPSHAALDWLMP